MLIPLSVTAELERVWERNGKSVLSRGLPGQAEGPPGQGARHLAEMTVCGDTKGTL